MSKQTPVAARELPKEIFEQLTPTDQQRSVILIGTPDKPVVIDASSGTQLYPPKKKK